MFALVAVMLTAAAPVLADEPGESDESAQLVRQGIALIVNTPGDMEGIEDKIVDAQEAPNQDGVDLELVAAAREAFERGAMHQVRALLERSIGARPHVATDDPLPVRETRGAPGMATGAETGIDVTGDPLEPDRSRSVGDWVAVAGLALVAGTGVALALRFRPHGVAEPRS